MDLGAKFTSIKPRESSGALTGSRFDFQANWGICKLLELHKGEGNYGMVFEYHDDIVIFPDTVRLDKVGFYQVKAKSSGNWTVKQLVKQDKGKNSILGKMYFHLMNFDEDVDSINFVSNADFSVRTKASGAKESCKNLCCSELDDNDVLEISDALKSEHSLKEDPEFQDVTYFVNTELDASNHSDITKAKIVDFIASKFPGISYQIPPIYNAIFGEVKRKSNCSDTFSDFTTLLQKKGISREEFNTMFDEIMKNTFDPFEVAKEIIARLNAEGAPVSAVQMFKENYREVCISNARPTNKFLDLQKMILKAQGSAPVVNLHDRMEEAWKELDIKDETLYTSDLIKSLIMFMLYEPKFSKANSKSSAKKS